LRFFFLELKFEEFGFHVGGVRGAGEKSIEGGWNVSGGFQGLGYLWGLVAIWGQVKFGWLEVLLNGF
jgi:hypothetical protein